MKKYTIYGLKDPLTNKLRYIGCSINIDNRYRQHLYNSKNLLNEKDLWINELLSNNFYPELIILDIIETDNRKKALNLEAKYINENKETLFNINDFMYDENKKEKVILLSMLQNEHEKLEKYAEINRRSIRSQAHWIILNWMENEDKKKNKS